MGPVCSSSCLEGCSGCVMRFHSTTKRESLAEIIELGYLCTMRNVRKVEAIPAYLSPYIAKQDPTLYTAIDHASWRFVMKLSQAFLGKHAHQKYLDGLRETGISTERIPLISEMDEALGRFGWQAVAVIGFIPP